MSAHDHGHRPLEHRRGRVPGAIRCALLLGLGLLLSPPAEAAERFVKPGSSSGDGGGSHFVPMEPSPSHRPPAANWSRWESPLYHFAIDMPNDLVLAETATEPGGLDLHSPDRRIEVRAYAQANTGHLDLATTQSRIRAGLTGATFDYERTFPDNFILSGTRNDAGFYVRVYLSADRSVFTFLVISHPRNLSQANAAMVARLSKSLVAARTAGPAPTNPTVAAEVPPKPPAPPTPPAPTQTPSDLERLKLQAEIERLKLEQLKLSQTPQSVHTGKEHDEAAAAPPPPVQTGRRVALVIGNGAYSDVPKLPTSAEDATRMTAMLRALGFQVTLGTDLARTAMTADLATFYEAAKGADVALFYFSGHGVQINGHNYLLPTDARFDDPQAALDIDGRAVDLQKFINAAGGAKTVLAFVDACRDNPIVEESLAKTFYKGIGGPTKGLAVVRKEDVGSGQFVGFAADEGKTAQTGDGPVSVYTDALLQLLPTPGEDISVLHRKIRSRVEEMTGGRQSPHAVDDLREALYLARKK